MLQLEWGDYRLRAGIGMTVLACASVLLFALLGRWQWHRAAEKRALAAAYATGAAGFTSMLGARDTAALPRYAEVRVRGRYLADRQFLLDNMIHGGRPGYQVLTPLQMVDGRLLLVNRGWLPLPQGRRDAIPDIGIADPSLVELRGRLDELPVPGLLLGRAPPALSGAWPRRTSYPTAAQLGAALGEAVEARQLLLAPTEPQGFVRDWQRSAGGFGPERHLGYALQWWGFGALTLALYFLLNVERRDT